MDRKKFILKKLREFKKGLAKKVYLEKIILFGSMAKGIIREDSDIDLIIVSKDFKGKKFRYRAIGFYDFWNISYPVDFLCYTPEEFNKLKRQVTIVREAYQNGIEI